ncbi:hypothetical protein AGMMS49546_34550 [Spirochaetia bacterium]|nr:hypothetical protein AGMMS49546_34550 [Spirochaetia bacterium]
MELCRHFFTDNDAGTVAAVHIKNVSQETIAIWTIFSTIIALVTLLDFGFIPSFTRNVSYIFSSAKTLKASGFDIVAENTGVDYGLQETIIYFKGQINDRT